MKFDYDYVKRVAYKWLRNTENAEDLTQDFYVWYMENIAKFDSSRSTYKKWFVANLVFFIQKYKHKHRDRGIVSLDNILFEDETYHECMPCYKHTNNIESAINRAAIIQASERITPRQREHILTYLEGHTTPTEIGEKAGLNPQAIVLSFKQSLPKIKKVLVRNENK